jgi:N-formylglutamate amidohydrolase
MAMMQHPTSTSQTEPPSSPVDRREPAGPLAPLVLASPHSGAYYPHDFISASPLEIATLRKSEDCYVDELFGDGPDLGAPLLRALYPRAYVDVNREPYELDPEMFEQPLPSFVNTTSARVASGLGTIARVVGNRREIYRSKLSFAEAERRIAGVHKPYHQTLRGLVARARQHFGFCILLDCHSMPSSGLPMDPDGEGRQVDIVLGDRNGQSCQSSLSEAVNRQLVATGYNVVRNNPYAGGYTTQHYGNPGDGIHALQIEVNRALYMDENTLQRSPGFAQLRDNLRLLIRRIIAYGAERAQELQYQRLSAE